MRQNFITYFNATSIEVPLFSVLVIALAALTSIGLLILIFQQAISRFMINKDILDENEKFTLRLSFETRDDFTPLLKPMQILSLSLFSVSYFILFIIGKAHVNGFFDAITLPIMILPALGLIMMGLYGLRSIGMELLFKITVVSVLILTMISRLLI